MGIHTSIASLCVESQTLGPSFGVACIALANPVNKMDTIVADVFAESFPSMRTRTRVPAEDAARILRGNTVHVDACPADKLAYPFALRRGGESRFRQFVRNHAPVFVLGNGALCVSTEERRWLEPLNTYVLDEAAPRGGVPGRRARRAIAREAEVLGGAAFAVFLSRAQMEAQSKVMDSAEPGWNRSIVPLRATSLTPQEHNCMLYVCAPHDLAAFLVLVNAAVDAVMTAVELTTHDRTERSEADSQRIRELSRLVLSGGAGLAGGALPAALQSRFVALKRELQTCIANLFSPSDVGIRVPGYVDFAAEFNRASPGVKLHTELNSILSRHQEAWRASGRTVFPVPGEWLDAVRDPRDRASETFRLRGGAIPPEVQRSMQRFLRMYAHVRDRFTVAFLRVVGAELSVPAGALHAVFPGTTIRERSSNPIVAGSAFLEGALDAAEVARAYSRSVLVYLPRSVPPEFKPIQTRYVARDALRRGLLDAAPATATYARADPIRGLARTDASGRVVIDEPHFRQVMFDLWQRLKLGPTQTHGGRMFMDVGVRFREAFAHFVLAVRGYLRRTRARPSDVSFDAIVGACRDAGVNVNDFADDASVSIAYAWFRGTFQDATKVWRWFEVVGDQVARAAGTEKAQVARDGVDAQHFSYWLRHAKECVRARARGPPVDPARCMPFRDGAFPVEPFATSATSGISDRAAEALAAWWRVYSALSARSNSATQDRILRALNGARSARDIDRVVRSFLVRE